MGFVEGKKIQGRKGHYRHEIYAFLLCPQVMVKICLEQATKAQEGEKRYSSTL